VYVVAKEDHPLFSLARLPEEEKGRARAERMAGLLADDEPELGAGARADARSRRAAAAHARARDRRRLE
jgi:hypothetical protein